MGISGEVSGAEFRWKSGGIQWFLAARGVWGTGDCEAGGLQIHRFREGRGRWLFIGKPGMGPFLGGKRTYGAILAMRGVSISPYAPAERLGGARIRI